MIDRRAVPSLVESDFIVTPALTAALSDGQYIQQIEMRAPNTPVGIARWHVDDPHLGVAQILQLHILPSLQRRGHGRRLVDFTIGQMRQFHAPRQVRLRRVWVNIRQKEQVIARAFLTQCGFNHVASMPDLFPGQDGLIYLRSMD